MHIIISFASACAQSTALSCGCDTYRACYLQSKKATAHPEANATLHFSPWNLRVPIHWSKHNSPSKTFRTFISFILHLTWEGTLMWNCLMICCGWCLNACMGILSWSPGFYFYPLCPFVFLQRGHVEGWRPSIEYRRDAFKQREARWRFDHAYAEWPGSSVPDWVWRLCYGWAHTHTYTGNMWSHGRAALLWG